LGLIGALLQYLPHCLDYFVVRVNPYSQFHRLLEHARMLPSDIREYEAAHCDNVDTRKKLTRSRSEPHLPHPSNLI